MEPERSVMIDRQNIGFYMEELCAAANHLHVTTLVFDCGGNGG
jgi:hypothetical protein